MRVQSYPNPFRETTQIRYHVPAAGPVELAIYDTLGRQVRLLVQGHHAPGPAEVTWDGRDAAGVRLPSGTYFGRLQTPTGRVAVGQMVLVR